MARRLVRKGRKKVGASPGTLVHVGEQRLEEARISLLRYDPQGLEERALRGADDCLAWRKAPGVSWINVDGLHDIPLLEELGEGFGIHPLVLEDILNTEHRPKFEDHDRLLFLVLKMLFLDEDGREIRTEQVSLIIGEAIVLSFQEAPGDVFEPVRERVRKGKGRIRKMGPDYLAYALIDAVVDSYFHILEKVGDRIEALEEELVSAPDSGTLQTIHALKREMILLRKSIWPLREATSALLRSESPLVGEETVIFLQDVYDHTIQVVDTVETFRDILSGMLDLYLSSVSNRMNEVMKVLTIIATIFIPLTFLAGIYGMNFEYIPELKWRWGYAVFWGVILGIGGGLVAFFRRRGWL